MPLSDRNIIINPNRGSSTEPTIRFTGADASSSATITLRVLNSGTIGTVSFEGNSGQLFSIVDNLSGSIFSVNDVSGIPSIEVLDTGVVKVAQYSGNVLIGTGTDDGSTKLQVNGGLKINGGYGIRLNTLGNVSGTASIVMSNGSYITATVTGNVTFTFTSSFTTGTGCGFVLQLTNGGNYSITWPASVRWPNGVAPSLTPNGTDILSFTTVDGGSNWRGVVSMYDSK